MDNEKEVFIQRVNVEAIYYETRYGGLRVGIPEIVVEVSPSRGSSYSVELLLKQFENRYSQCRTIRWLSVEPAIDILEILTVDQVAFFKSKNYLQTIQTRGSVNFVPFAFLFDYVQVRVEVRESTLAKHFGGTEIDELIYRVTARSSMPKPVVRARNYFLCPVVDEFASRCHSLAKKYPSWRFLPSLAL